MASALAAVGNEGGSLSAPAGRVLPLTALLLALLLAGLGQGCTPLHTRGPSAFVQLDAVGAQDFRPAASDAQCASWDDARLIWGVVGTVSGALGAAGGGFTLLTDLVGEDRGAQLALGLTSVLLGALTVGASYAEDGLTARFTERCMVLAPLPAAR